MKKGISLATLLHDAYVMGLVEQYNVHYGDLHMWDRKWIMSATVVYDTHIKIMPGRSAEDHFSSLWMNYQ